MHFVRAKRGSRRLLVFELGQGEAAWLLATLPRYPLLDSGFHRLSKSGAATDAQQKFLEEVMTEERRSHQKMVRKFVLHPRRFQSGPADRLFLELTEAETDWLLRILNDLRVGSWVKLGRPGQEEYGRLMPTPANVADLATLMRTGQMQAALLQALDHPGAGS